MSETNQSTFEALMALSAKDRADYAAQLLAGLDAAPGTPAPHRPKLSFSEDVVLFIKSLDEVTLDHEPAKKILQRLRSEIVQ